MFEKCSGLLSFFVVVNRFVCFVFYILFIYIKIQLNNALVNSLSVKILVTLKPGS